MITPGRDWKIDNFGIWVMTCKECTSDTEGTSPREGLRDGYLGRNNLVTTSEKMCEPTAFAIRGALSVPYASLAAPLVNIGRPVIGRYSLSCFEVAKIASACDGNF